MANVNPIKGLTPEQVFAYVFKKAKEYGDPHPEVVAAQFALESASGTSPIAQRTNNAFGQTTFVKNDEPAFKDDKGKQYYWKKYNSIDDSIKDRSTGKWAKNRDYINAKDPISAMAAIQPTYAPSAHDNGHYMKGIASSLKANGFYNGNTDLPNADVNPDFYKQHEMNSNKDYVVDKKTEEQVWKDYNNAKDVILYDDELPDPIKTIEVDKLNQEYFQKGYINKDGTGLIQIKTKKINEERKLKQAEELQDFKDITNLLGNDNLVERDYVGSKDKNKENTYKLDTPEQLEKYRRLIQKYPELEKISQKDKKGRVTITLHPLGQRGITGTEWAINPDKGHKIAPDSQSVKLLKRIQKNAKNLGIDGFDYYDENGQLQTGITEEEPFTIYNPRSPNQSILTIGTKTSKFDINNADKAKSDYQPLPVPSVNPNWVVNPIEEQVVAQKEADGEPVTKAETVADTIDDTEVDASGKSNLVKAYDEYFNSEIVEPDDMGGYDPKAFKNDFPFADMIGNVAGIATGLNMANRDTPRRDERVSPEFLQYTAELKRLSEIGLRPEDEAHAKQMLSESYQGMLEQINKAANGNRNIVLGNLGRADAQNQRGLLNLAIADSEAKDRNLAMYGEATKYINEFDARRNIANNERDYNEAMMTKEAGAQLASASFSKMMNDIQYQKENGPGSANHMYKTYMMRKWYGVDPNLKDDGSGTIKYTPSWKDKQDEKLYVERELLEDNRQRYNMLSPEEKQKSAELFYQTNADPTVQNNFMKQYAENKFEGRMDFRNYNEAVKNNDYSLMFENASSAGKWEPTNDLSNKYSSENLSNQNKNDMVIGNVPILTPKFMETANKTEEEDLSFLERVQTSKNSNNYIYPLFSE